MSSTHPNGGIAWDGPLFHHPWWIGSVGEAVGMISYERNADRVLGTFYVRKPGNSTLTKLTRHRHRS